MLKQEAASSDFPEDHGRKKSSFFFIFCDIVILTDESTTMLPNVTQYYPMLPNVMLERK